MKFAAFSRVAACIMGISCIFAPIASGAQSCKCPKNPGPGGGVQCAKDQIATCDPSSGECNCTCDSVQAGKTKAEYEAQIFSKVLHTKVDPAELSSPQLQGFVSSFRESAGGKGKFSFDKEAGSSRGQRIEVGVPDWVEEVLRGKGGISIGPGAFPMSQECAPGAKCAMSNGQQGGIVQLNIDTHPHLILTDEQQAAIAGSLAHFAGRKCFIMINNATEETALFGKRLRAAMKDAGIECELESGMTFMEGGGAMPSPLFVQVGKNNQDLALALNSILFRSKVVGAPIQTAPSGDADSYMITVTAPN